MAWENFSLCGVSARSSSELWLVGRSHSLLELLLRKELVALSLERVSHGWRVMECRLGYAVSLLGQLAAYCRRSAGRALVQKYVWPCKLECSMPEDELKRKRASGRSPCIGLKASASSHHFRIRRSIQEPKSGECVYCLSRSISACEYCIVNE